MTDTTAPRPGIAERLPPASAGGLLRQARQAQGMSIAMLAAAIKVVPKKLEALEADRLEELPDATFARALAQAVCRVLKTDPRPVLALLPPLSGPRRLEEVAEGLNTPFRESPGRLAPREWAHVTGPVLALAALIVLATLVVYLLPTHWQSLFDAARRRSAAAPGNELAAGATTVSPLVAASAASEPEVPGRAPGAEPATAGPDTGAAPSVDAASGAVPATAGPSPAIDLAADAAAPAASAPSGWLQLQASAPSWVGVTDAHGRALIFRLLQAGEQVALDGDAPLKLRIGNANAVRLTVRGAPFDLATATRDNVARLEIK